MNWVVTDEETNETVKNVQNSENLAKDQTNKNADSISTSNKPNKKEEETELCENCKKILYLEKIKQKRRNLPYKFLQLSIFLLSFYFVLIRYSTFNEIKQDFCFVKKICNEKVKILYKELYKLHLKIMSFFEKFIREYISG
ncbi:hypothetical protein GVAV_000821 [Gurleya vavrai]